MCGGILCVACGEGDEIMPVQSGSWPDLVIQGGLKVSPRFSVRRRVGKTAPSLGESFSIPRVEVPMLSTSPNLAKSRMALS
jgi:hypothetical protein